MTVWFIPLDPNTPQDAVAKRLAQLLADKGVTDTAALSTAIDILVGIQAAMDDDDPLAAVGAWDKRKARRESFARKNSQVQHLQNVSLAVEWRRRLQDRIAMYEKSFFSVHGLRDGAIEGLTIAIEMLDELAPDYSQCDNAPE